MARWGWVGWLLMGCAETDDGALDPSGDDSGVSLPTAPTSDTDSPPVTTPPIPTLCDGRSPDVTALYTTARPGLVHTVDVHATLDGEAAVAVACTRADNPEEVLLASAGSASTHLLPLRGLAADATYDCKFVATCPSSGSPKPFTIRTAPLPSHLPVVAVSEPSVTASTAPNFLLVGHDRHCIGDNARLLMFDYNGEIRWSYEGVPDIDIAFESQYLGAGLFSWGGGYYDGQPPELVDVDHNVLYVTDSPVAQSGLFHHDGRIIGSGEMMLMMIEGASTDTQAWDGFAIGLVDTTTNTDTFVYSSQTAVDDGDLPAGWGDPWHANWADYQHDPVNGDRLYVSLCNLGDVIAIDANTQEVLWTLGNTGDFTVVYPSGETVPAHRAYPQCQHGLEFAPFPGGGGGNLLVYDNGSHGRGYSRLVEYEIDETTMVATFLWAWTEPVWMEPSWGDADYLPGGHVLATMGHACWSPNGGDVSSVVEVDPVSGDVAWRLDFPSPDDAIYRAERVDACDIFPISTMCPGVQVALDAIAPLLDPCGPLGTDVDEDGDGAFLCADGDCDDRDATVFVGAPESCDGLDNDCNGTFDDGFPSTEWYVDGDADGYGGTDIVLACAQPPGATDVGGDCDDGQPAAWPANPEQCDGLDNDCNAAVDESPSCWGCTDTGTHLGCTTRLPWPEAEQVCRDLGAELVSIDDDAENQAVAALAVGEAWLGYNDRAVEGTFVWSDGNPATYAAWWDGEPNDWGGNEDCTGTNFAYFARWNDYNCDSTNLPFVCEW